MGVGAQRRGRRRVAESPLHGDHVAPRGDQPGRVEVPRVVQPDAAHVRASGRPSPQVGDPVVVPRRPTIGEEPARRIVPWASPGDVLGEQLDELLGQVDDPFRAPFGGTTSIPPQSARCSCRGTVNVRRRKSTSRTRTPAASPVRSPAKAHSAVNARNGVRTPSSIPTCSGDGIRMAAPARRLGGSRTREHGSTAITLSRIAARNTARTCCKRTPIVDAPRAGRHRRQYRQRRRRLRQRPDGDHQRAVQGRVHPHHRVPRRVAAHACLLGRDRGGAALLLSGRYGSARDVVANTVGATSAWRPRWSSVGWSGSAIDPSRARRRGRPLRVVDGPGRRC